MLVMSGSENERQTIPFLLLVQLHHRLRAVYSSSSQEDAGRSTRRRRDCVDRRRGVHPMDL